MRFYCGTPLIASNGHRLGTLCFADNEAHSFDAERCNILNNMAELCVREIERDFVIRRQSMESTEQLVSALRPCIIFLTDHTWSMAGQCCTTLKVGCARHHSIKHEARAAPHRERKGLTPTAQAICSAAVMTTPCQKYLRKCP